MIEGAALTRIRKRIGAAAALDSGADPDFLHLSKPSDDDGDDNENDDRAMGVEGDGFIAGVGGGAGDGEAGDKETGNDNADDPEAAAAAAAAPPMSHRLGARLGD